MPGRRSNRSYLDEAEQEVDARGWKRPEDARWEFTDDRSHGDDLYAGIAERVFDRMHARTLRGKIATALYVAKVNRLYDRAMALESRQETRRSLGSSSFEHGRRLASLWKSANTHVDEVRHRIARGDCRGAYDQLLYARGLYGMAFAHLEGIGRKPSHVETPNLNRLMDDLKGLERDVGNHCIRSREERLRTALPSAMAGARRR